MSLENTKIIDGVVVLREFDDSSLPNPDADSLYLFADDSSGTTVIKYKTSDGHQSVVGENVVPGESGNLMTSDGENWVSSPNNAGAIMVSAKNISLLTAGSPQDIGTIPMPAWINRFYVATSFGATSRVLTETASGAVSPAAITLFNQPSGSGSAISTATSIAVSGSMASINGSAAPINHSGTPLYIRQTANSSNAGTISVYLVVIPVI